MEKSQVFVGWSGTLGQRIAEALQSNLFQDFPFADLWVSSLNIEVGKNWLQQLSGQLDKVQYAIILVSPCTAGAPWLNFEAGITYGRLKEIFVLTVGEAVPERHPFRTIQVADGTNLNDLKKVFRRLVDNQQAGFADKWVEQQGPRWIAECNRIIGTTEGFKSINSLIDALQNATRELERNSGIFSNPLFHFVVAQSLRSISSQLNGIVGDYTVSAELYPEYLAAIQKALHPKVSAMALVEQEEFYWRGRQGKQILDSASKSNERVFVLTNLRHLMDFYPVIREHTRRYKVYVLTTAQLIEHDARFAFDFSIIELEGTKMLATYVDEGVHRRSIRFSIEPSVLDEYGSVFESIRRVAACVENKDYAEQEIEELLSGSRVSPSERKTVEMSTYIPIHEYDQHEEDHEYYKEMMSEMMRLVVTSPRRGESMRVLEFGAGTGIFTSRLVSENKVREIVAVECDWSCFDLLRHKFRNKTKVRAEYEDSRLFNPTGDFDVIVSSFADHHIRPLDKQQYFRNVKINMRPGALFIVGDEFLRVHDHNDKNERDAALEAYHNHIIDAALSKGQQALADLERKALESGKQSGSSSSANVGDFKVSCQHYERMLAQAGFSFKRRLIGPDEALNIGGVYVYCCWLKDDVLAQNFATTL